MKFIVTADWHLRKTVPRCRTETEEEWLEFQTYLVEDILGECSKKGADLIIAGDIFDRANPGTGFVNHFSQLFQSYTLFSKFAIPGNHDLPYHDINLVNESGFGTLEIHKVISTHSNKFSLIPFNFIMDPKLNLAVCHQLCFEKQAPPNVNAITAKDLLKKYPKTQWIVAGDNHHGFHYKDGNRHVIVPGSIFISAVDQIRYKPKIYYINTETELVEPIYLRNDESKLTSEYLEDEKKRDSRIDNFIESIRAKGKVSFSFGDNLEKKLNQKTISPEIKKIIIGIREEVK